MKDCAHQTNVFIATLSQPNTYNLRMGIRNSWKKDIPKTFTHKFFIGLTQNESLQKMNENEAQKYGDIVFTNLIDSYLNLTLKMSSVFQWQQKFCPKISFFLRADEDTVLDVSRFQHYLNIKFNMLKRSYGNTTIFGTLLKNSPVFRDPNGKWYVPYELYNDTNFPPYESGSSYLAAPWAIELMLREAKNQKYITVDDAFFTGIIAEKAKIPRISAHRHFAYRNPLATNSWDQQCDDNGIPLLFSIVDENGEIKISPNGHEIALKKLKELKCSLEK
uniref:Hexosyltransferase n=1 Tax=Panagrolaimus sp. PS1159 TaxID=55785 RepID=A0AC35FJX2_9BILA